MEWQWFGEGCPALARSREGILRELGAAGEVLPALWGAPTGQEWQTGTYPLPANCSQRHDPTMKSLDYLMRHARMPFVDDANRVMMWR